MLSRIADSIYWMSRYLERAANTARLVEINLLHLIEAEDTLPETAQWRPLLSINNSEDIYAQLYEGAEVSARRVIQFLTQDRQSPNSIRNSLRLARENARVVRDRISKEMWEALNELWLFSEKQLKAPLLPERAARFYADVRNGVARFHGVTISTMMRGNAFGFYLLGTCLERADMTARILDVKYHLLLPSVAMVGSPLDYYQWAAMLKSLSGFEAYRRTYQAGLRPVDVVEFVVFERDFPRSLSFSTERMGDALESIGLLAADSPTAAAMEKVRRHLRSASAEEVVRGGLHEYLQGFLDKIEELHAELAQDYFEAPIGEIPCAT